MAGVQLPLFNFKPIDPRHLVGAVGTSLPCGYRRCLAFGRSLRARNHPVRAIRTDSSAVNALRGQRHIYYRLPVSRLT